MDLDRWKEKLVAPMRLMWSPKWKLLFTWFRLCVSACVCVSVCVCVVRMFPVAKACFVFIATNNLICDFMNV